MRFIEQWEYQVGSTEQPQQREDQRTPDQQLHSQTAVQASAPTLQLYMSAPPHQHTPPRNAPNACAVPGLNDELVEVDMGHEEPPLPTNGTGPFAQPANHPASTIQRPSPTGQGRSTNDSIYSPRNARQATRSHA